MKLNWAERWVVNNPSRIIQQKIEIKWLERMLPLKTGATILEIGCGRGAGASLILKYFKPDLLLAQDLDFSMIQKAIDYLSVSERKAIALAVGDAYRIPVKDGSVDAVFGFGVLHHVPNWQSALKEIARVLKTDGIYYIEELYPTLYQNFITRRILLHPDKNRFDSADLHAELENSDLLLKDVIEFKLLGLLGAAVKLG